MTVRVLWLQVWALALMQGAITLAWVFYQLYLKSLLTGLGMDASLAMVILLVENGLATLVEPVVGSCSDDTQRWLGTRFPWIVAGGVGASLLFLLIPSILGFPRSVAQAWLIPLLLAWALAMSVFRAPAMSLLGRYAFATRLPQAASVLTLVGSLAAAVGVVAQPLIVSWGGGLTFALGSGVLLGATLLLQQVHPPSEAGAVANPTVGLVPSHLVLIFGTGMAVSVGFRLLVQSLPEPRVAMLGSLFLTVAVTAIPAGTLAQRWGNSIAMLTGLGVMAAGLLLLTQVQSAGMGVAVTVLVGASLSLVLNGAIPFALGLVPPARAGLGTGMYFGGGALGASLFLGFLTPDLSAQVASWLGMAAFLVAGGLVSLSLKTTH
ncbi:MFS transporter [Gloeomargaritales cyanobacterium VI4D9]|nr:MFS transporter [Gloeomargaritales cyanobacterium VI4D9]